MQTSRLEAIAPSKEFRMDVCESLSQSPIFKDLSWSELEAFSTYISGYKAPAGVVLFAEGEIGDSMALLLSGEIAVQKNDDFGKPQNVATISAGRTFGEMSVIDGEPRSATCITVKPCVLALLPTEQFERLLRVNEKLSIKLLLRVTKLLSQRLRKMSGVLVDYLGKDH